MKKLLLCLLILLAIGGVGAKAQFFTGETAHKANELMSRGDISGAIAILDKAIEKSKDLFESYQMRANLRMMQRNLDGAIDDLSSAIEIKPNIASLYAQRAQFRLFKRDSAGALKDYDYAIANGMKTEKVYAGRASVKRDLRDFDGAANDYRAAIAIRPKFAGAYVGFASMLDQKGETDAAISELQTFLDDYEKERDGKLPQTKTENFGERVTIKREGKEVGGGQVFLEGQQIKTEINANTPEELERQTEKLEQKMNLALAFTNLGSMYERKGDLEKAAVNVEKALSINPNDAYPLNLRGKINLKKGDLDAAIADLTIAIDKFPAWPDSYANRGIAYLLQSKEAEAQKDFDKFLQLAPDVTKESLEKRIAAAKENWRLKH